MKPIDFMLFLAQIFLAWATNKAYWSTAAEDLFEGKAHNGEDSSFILPRQNEINREICACSLIQLILLLGCFVILYVNNTSLFSTKSVYIENLLVLVSFWIIGTIIRQISKKFFSDISFLSKEYINSTILLLTLNLLVFSVSAVDKTIFIQLLIIIVAKFCWFDSALEKESLNRIKEYLITVKMSKRIVIKEENFLVINYVILSTIVIIFFRLVGTLLIFFQKTM